MYGGNGGFGGAGGDGDYGGSGGFGGGGVSQASAYASPGQGGFGAGDATLGVSLYTKQGGGGLGAGGAVFVQQGGQLAFVAGKETGSSVSGGAGGNYGSALGSGLFIQGDQQVTFSSLPRQTTTFGDVIADQTGSGGAGYNAGAGSLLINGLGTVALSGANTFAGGTTLTSGTLSLQSTTAAGTGAITFGAGSAATLQVGYGDAPANTITGFAQGETIDLAGVGFETTATPGASNAYTFSGGSASVTLHFDVSRSFAGLTFHFASDGQGGTDLTLVPAQPSTVTGAAADQPTTDETAIAPLAGVSITDPNLGTPTEMVTVTPSSTANGALSNLGGGRLSNGTHTVSGTAASVTAALNGLVFTPTAHEVAPGQTVTTAFTITDLNAADQVATDTTTSVIATAQETPPAITVTPGIQYINDEQATTPFARAILTDPDVGQTETVTLTLTDGGLATDADGALSGTGLSRTGNGTYQLTGTSAGGIAALQAALNAVVFTPTSHQVSPGSAVTTGFALSISDGAVTDTANASIVAVALNDAPGITGTIAGQGVTDVTSLVPLVHVMITDPDVGVQDGVALTLTGAGGAATDANGTLSGAGLNKTGPGTYSLAAGSPASVTAALDAVTFTPTAHQVAPGQTVTTGIVVTATQNGARTTDSTTSITTTAVFVPPTITGTSSSQTTTDYVAIKPFSDVTISDPVVGAQDSLVIEVTGSTGTLSDANGILSGAGLTKTGVGTYALLATTPAILTRELRALTFTPVQHEVAAGQTVTTTFALAATYHSQTGTSSATSVVATALNYITGPASGGVINGTSGNDVISARGYGNTIFSNGGNDIIAAGQGNATVNAASGNDVITLAGYNDTVVGTNGSNAISGAQGNATVTLGDGNNIVQLGGYNDSVALGNGNDTVTGPLGNAQVKVGNGDDVITLAGNNNLVRAGSTTGTDFINAGVGGETVTGGDGNFIITAGGYNNIVVLSNGTDMVFLPADAANPSVPVGSPVLADLGGANVTTGTGNDTIKLGGYGNRVDAGSGSNVIFGGAGNDTFVLPKAFQGLDTISGFNEANGDILDIRNALAATSWNHSAATLGTYLQIVSSPSQTSIAITPNGTGPSSTIAVLSGSGNLALADLLSHHSLLVG